MNIEKHCIYIEQDKETLLERTIRLIRKYDSHHIINIFILDTTNKTKYTYENTNLIIINSKIFTIQKTSLALETICIFIQKQLTTNDEKHYILLFGDTYFSEEIIQKLMLNTNPNITFFGRENASTITKKEYGEIYAISFQNNHISLLHNKFIELHSLYKQKKIFRIKHWELYRLLNNIKPTEHVITNNFIEINDFTEDFDYPSDYIKWIEEYSKCKENII